ncbi:MAG: hypothetical protein QXM96_00285 [Candidatus Woesearchaeota archaeon]
MKYFLITDDTDVLIYNDEHKNFTKTNEIIKKGTIIQGEAKDFEGLKKSKNFTYKIIELKNKKIIFQKNTKPMETTEITLSADGKQTNQASVTSEKKYEQVQTTNKKAQVLKIVLPIGIAGLTYYFVKNSPKKTIKYGLPLALLAISYFVLNRKK